MDFCEMFPKRRKIASGRDGETSSAISKTDYEVFLSFRGPDTRQGFTDCLYHAMVDAGIHVFRDDDELRPGDKLDEILQAIDNSKICVVVLSRTYAASACCLREVERIVNMKKDVVPIFYDVTPDDVKLKTQLYDDALMVHETKYEKEQVQQWREALKEIPRIKGRELKNSGFVEFSRQLAKEIMTKLKLKHKYEIKNLVEVPNEVEAALKLLDIGCGGRRFLGIYGMGGIGKTTLAKIIFNQISDSFDCSCFLENVRENSSQGQDGLRDLQELLLKSLDPSLRDATHVVDPMKRIQTIFQRKRVVIVLDDIDQRNHIDGLVGDSSTFGTGSRIIFTTTNKGLHEQETSSNADFYGLEKKEMDSKQSLKLFSKHAFGKDSPPGDYMDLSCVVISVTGRLPLALEVVGSLLHRKKAKVWRSMINKLKEAPNQAVQRKLKLSFDALESEQQEIFLDIACFFIGEDKTDPIYMWEACGFHPDHGIEVLISMSLIKIKDKKYFWMHDQLRDFGRAIVKENSKDPRASSRLWMHKDALDMLKRNAGKEKVEALHVGGPSGSLDRENFVGLEKLRFLRLINRANFSGDFVGLIPKLRWLSLSYESSCNVTNLYLKELVVLELSSCRFDETWRGWSQILISENLKVLTLWRCTCMPDLSKLVNLERLVLDSCELTSIHSSVGKLRCLKHLTLRNCHSLRELPEQLTSLEGLKHIVLNFSNLRFQFDLPESIGCLVSLTRLDLRNLGVTKLPNNIGQLVKLKHLSLERCGYLKVLPESIGCLRSLVSLNLSHTGITEMPTTTGRLAKLESLCLSGCLGLERLPDSIVNLHSLIDLNVSCSSILELPDSFGDLTSLQKLDLKESRIRSLPNSVRYLEKLEVLDIGNRGYKGEWIDELPELPIGLTMLKVYKVQKIQNLSNLVNLTHLKIDNWELFRIPSEPLEPLVLEGIGKVSKLKHLDVKFFNVESLPMDLNALQQLNSLTLRCPNLELMPQLPSNLESLDLEVKQLAQLPINLSSLKSLSSLKLANFVIEAADGLEGLESLPDLEMEKCIIEYNDFPVLKRLTYMHLSIFRSRGTFPDILWLDRPVTLNEIPRIGSQLGISLSDLKNLSKLELAHFVIEADGFKIIGVDGLESLEALEMNSCTLKFNDFPVLRSLRSLNFEWCRFPTTTCPDISRLDRLVSLSINYCMELIEIPGIGKLKSLTHLSISFCRSLRRIEDLSELNGPASIWIYNCRNFVGINGIDRLLSAGTVSVVDISGCNCKDVKHPSIQLSLM